MTHLPQMVTRKFLQHCNSPILSIPLQAINVFKDLITVTWAGFQNFDLFLIINKLKKILWKAIKYKGINVDFKRKYKRMPT